MDINNTRSSKRSNKRVVAISVGLVAAFGLGVGIIVMMMSSPRNRTVTVSAAPAKRAIDAAAARREFEAQVAKYRAAGEMVSGEEMARAAELTRAGARTGAGAASQKNAASGAGAGAASRAGAGAGASKETGAGASAGTSAGAGAGAEKNAAVLLVQAVAILDKFDVPANHPFFNMDVQPAMADAKWKVINDALGGPLAPVLAKLDEASRLAVCVWDVKYTSPLFRTVLPHLNGVRELADLAHRSALAAHHAGRDDEALRRIAQVLKLARWTDQQPFVVTHLVALGVSRQASETAKQIMPTLKIGDAPGDANAAQVKALIADFLDDAWARNALREALMAERLGLIDTATSLETGKVTAKEIAKVISWNPTVPTAEITPGEAYFDALPMMKMIDPMIEAASSAQRLEQFQAKAPAAQPPPPSIMAAMMPTLNRAGVTHYTALARMRLAATVLAARSWMAQHGGQPPATLGDLVPANIAAIPLDPLATTDGATLSYKPAPQPTIVGTSVGAQGRMEMRLTEK